MIRIICFDIDDTICTTSKKNYFSAKPKVKVIKKINELYNKGYTIKLFTSRFMGRNNENVSRAKKQGLKQTQRQLKKWNLKYHNLIFGKPSFDLFVDDKSINFDKDWVKKIDKFLAKQK